MSLADALAQTVNGSTLDTMYWNYLVRFVKLAGKYHFKSVGSKPVLMTIASEISDSGIKTVSVCVDADYDRCLGRLPSLPRLAHTYGYSWESDILHRPVLSKIIESFIGPIPKQTHLQFERSLTKLESELTRWSEIDLAFRSRNIPCILDRKKPLSIVDLATDLPTLNQTVLKKKLLEAGYKRAPKRIMTINKSETLRVCFGKLVSKLLYHVVSSFILRTTNKIRLDYDTFLRLAMKETFSLLEAGEIPELAQHMNGIRPALT